MKNKKNLLINSVIVVFVILFALYAESLYSPPPAAPADAPITSFSAQRAMTHVKAICRKPHFIGTIEHDKVRDYILKTAKELGLTVETQTTTAINNTRRGLTAARITNIIAVLKGAAPGKAILIAGHYDSMLHTPGAADDGSAVAAMLETARALTRDKPLKNDTIFLFTDSEEQGLMGAKAFADEHPLLKNVGVVFNLEARGNTGTSVTFEVSGENGWIMKEYARTMPYPFAASIMYEVYKLLPNDTDFTVFKKAGVSGFNAAFIDGYVNYHSPTDTPANLDPRSLQHHGSYILNFARHFGNLTITDTKEKDVVFFNPIGHWLVLYPGWLNLPLAILVFILYVFYLVLGIKKKQLTLWGIVGGFFLFIANAALITFLASLLQRGIKALYPQYGHFYNYNFYNIHYYFYVFIGVAAAIFTLVYFLLFKKFKAGNFQAGAITFFILLLILLYIKMPTAAYLAIYPLLFMLAAGIIARLLNWSEEEKYTHYALLQLLAVLPALALFTPLIKLLFVVFSLGMGYISALIMVFLLGFLIPQVKAAYDLNKFALPVLAVLIALAGFTAGHITSLPNEKQPLQTSVVYCLDADNQKALWSSKYLETDDWNQQFFEEPTIGPLVEIYPEPTAPRLKNDAPLVTLPTSRVKILEDEITENNKRRLHFTLSAWKRGNSMFLYFHKEAGITGITVDGKPVPVATAGFYTPQGSDYHYMIYYGVPAEGVDFVLESQPGKPIRLVVIDWKLGLPVIPGVEFKPMPAHIIPDKENSHFTVIKKTFSL